VQYTVSFNANGGSDVADMKCSQITSCPVSTWAGGALEGWYPNFSFIAAEKISFPLDVTSDRTLYARWIQATDGLSYAAVTGGYSVSLGTATDVAITIPAYWLGDPVVAVTDHGFDMDTLTSPPTITSVSIPETVTSIGEYAFSSCRFTSIELPSKLTSLGDWAFAYCRFLTSISVPAGVTTIGSRTFYANDSLEGVSLPGVTSLGYNTFGYCEKLTTFSAPNLQSTGYGVFSNCTALTSFTLPASMLSIGSGAFRYCTALATLALERSTTPLTYLDSDSLEGCAALTSIKVPSSRVADYQGASNWSTYSGIITAQ